MSPLKAILATLKEHERMKIELSQCLTQKPMIDEAVRDAIAATTLREWFEHHMKLFECAKGLAELLTSVNLKTDDESHWLTVFHDGCHGAVSVSQTTIAGKTFKAWNDLKAELINKIEGGK